MRDAGGAILWGSPSTRRVFGYEPALAWDRFVNPVTGRSARVGMSPEQEATLGLQSYRQVLASETVVTAGPEVDLVNRVAKRLAEAAGDSIAAS